MCWRKKSTKNITDDNSSDQLVLNRIVESLGKKLIFVHRTNDPASSTK